MQQADLYELKQAIETSPNPLDIVNAWHRMPEGVRLPGEYWMRRICDVALWIVDLTTELRTLRALLEDVEKHGGFTVAQRERYDKIF